VCVCVGGWGWNNSYLVLYKKGKEEEKKTHKHETKSNLVPACMCPIWSEIGRLVYHIIGLVMGPTRPKVRWADETFWYMNNSNRTLGLALAIFRTQLFSCGDRTRLCPAWHRPWWVRNVAPLGQNDGTTWNGGTAWLHVLILFLHLN